MIPEHKFLYIPVGLLSSERTLLLAVRIFFSKRERVVERGIAWEVLAFGCGGTARCTSSKARRSPFNLAASDITSILPTSSDNWPGMLCRTLSV